MNISNANSLVPVPSLSEISSLKSPRDSNSHYKHWKFIAKLAELINKHSSLINQMSRDVKRLQERRTKGFDLYPFCIYTVPIELRPSADSAQYTGSANWRTVRVRGGFVLTSVVSTGSYVIGTDLMQNYSYLSSYPPALVGSYDIQVPANTSQYWFWIEPSSSNYYLRYASDPSVPSSGNPNTWPGFPTAKTGYIPIGYVDTSTSSSINRSYVRQFLTNDVIVSGGGPNTSNGTVLYNFSQSFGDYVVGSDGAGNLYQIAKPPEIRCSITSKVIYGNTFTYTYPHNPTNPSTVATHSLAFQFRQSSNATNGNVYESLIPAYTLNDKIIAISNSSTGVISVGADPTTISGSIITIQQVSPCFWAVNSDQLWGIT